LAAVLDLRTPTRGDGYAQAGVSKGGSTRRARFHPSRRALRALLRMTPEFAACTKEGKSEYFIKQRTGGLPWNDATCSA
jgi:hypothetical protein